MPSTSRDPVVVVQGAVARWADRLGAGLWCVACSGGADSLSLADAAIDVLGPAGVVVVAIDHGLAAGSARVAADVAAWARGRGAAAIVRAVDVPRAGSIEAAARAARYAALEQVADEIGASWIAVGHTARDQAETVLLRIVRGTGPAGLAAMVARRGRIVRPLLELERAVIEAYTAARGLAPWQDPMNADDRLARVRVRRVVLPALRGENAAIDGALVRLAASAREWLEVIDRAAEPLARFPIACGELAGRPAAVRKRAIALALERAGLGYEAAHLDALDQLASGEPRGEVGVDVAGARVIRSYDQLELARTAEVAPAEAPADYELRVWQPGDRMRPARLKGRSRKLSDLYIDAKIPRALRQHARVMIRRRDRVIVWAEHVGVAFGESPALAPLRSAGSF